jgi:hypothetical protein
MIRRRLSADGNDVKPCHFSPNTRHWTVSVRRFSPEVEIVIVDRAPSDLQMQTTLRRHALAPVNVDVNHTADSRLSRRFRHGRNR